MTHLFCQRILQALEAAGVADMIVTPGSRSTPLLLAALQARIRLHSVIDERCASFFALGRARARGGKVALLCTSGSAGAHYLPALLEARYSEHCLVAITADRPPEMHGTGANQTIHQELFFAAACPPCIELGVPDGSEEAATLAYHRVYQSVAAARGPVHINLAFQKPLEPADRSAISCPEAHERRSSAGPQVSSEQTSQIRDLCQRAERGVIVCGPASSEALGNALSKLAKSLGFALLAETTSGARTVGETHPLRFDAFPHILASKPRAQALRPDLVLQFGFDPANAALGRWMDHDNVMRIRFSGSRLLRAPNESVRVLQGEETDVCEQLAAVADTSGNRTSSYIRAWRDADRACWAAVDKNLQAATDESLSEASITASVLLSLSQGTQLTLGNSLPIRSVDSVVPGRKLTLRVLYQRGASGIEGLICGAIGSSTRGTRSALLIGDVSCAHDLAGLALHRLSEGPLAIFVIDNAGGQIFSTLPISQVEMPPEHWRYWQTPPIVNFGAVCAAYDVAYRECRHSEQLAETLLWANEYQGVCMLRLVVGSESMRTFLRSVQESLA